jgi:hypothetical protein
MDLTDKQWEILEPLFRPRRRPDGRGRPWQDSRAVLNGVLWVLRTGAPWHDLPPRYPPYLKPMRELNAIAVAGTEIAQGAINPVFSPDGRSLTFFSGADRTYKRIAVSGGAAVTICQADAPLGMSWGLMINSCLGRASRASCESPQGAGNRRRSSP